jgi:hypothetical protein
MTQKDLVELFAERCTMGAIAQGFVPKTRRRKVAREEGKDK